MQEITPVLQQMLLQTLITSIMTVAAHMAEEMQVLMSPFVP